MVVGHAPSTPTLLHLRLSTAAFLLMALSLSSQLAFGGAAARSSRKLLQPTAQHPGQCTPVANFTVTPNAFVDISKVTNCTSERDTSLDAAAAACRGNALCKGFTATRPATEPLGLLTFCFLLDAVPSLVASTGDIVCLYKSTGG